MNDKTCCFIGHSEIRKNITEALAAALATAAALALALALAFLRSALSK